MEWKIIDGKLSASIEFKSQTDLAEFLLKVAKIADDMNHHPDYHVFKCSKVQFSLFTHDKNSITDLDYQLSEKINNLI